MKFIIAIAFSFLLFSNYSFSQCGLGLGLTLTKQDEVDAFLVNYCKDFKGSLRILDNSDSLNKIVDLSPLMGLKSIDGILRISCNSLMNLNGLDSLQNVGALHLHSNKNLKNISSLGKLNYTYGDLWIADNESLTNLDGLSNISQVGGYLILQSNDNLNNIDGFSKLRTVRGIRIHDNNVLLNLNGLNNVLPNSIYDNPLNLDEISIYNNDLLSVCASDFICEVIKRTDLRFKIENNNVSCNSTTEISNNCLSTSSEFQVENSIKIYPNPTIDRLTIELIHPETLFIYDYLGMLKDRILLNAGNNAIDFSSKNQGIYYLKCNNKVSKILKI